MEDNLTMFSPINVNLRFRCLHTRSILYIISFSSSSPVLCVNEGPFDLLKQILFYSFIEDKREIPTAYDVWTRKPSFEA